MKRNKKSPWGKKKSGGKVKKTALGGAAIAAVGLGVKKVLDRTDK